MMKLEKAETKKKEYYDKLKEDYERERLPVINQNKQIQKQLMRE